LTQGIWGIIGAEGLLEYSQPAERGVRLKETEQVACRRGALAAMKLLGPCGSAWVSWVNGA
jgi:hypothetical protein